MGGRGGDVFGFQPLLDVPAPAHGRVILADQADHFIGQQAPQVQVVRGLRPVSNDDIGLALRQLRV